MMMSRARVQDHRPTFKHDTLTSNTTFERPRFPMLRMSVALAIRFEGHQALL